jgi:hypothetical protein
MSEYFLVYPGATSVAAGGSLPLHLGATESGVVVTVNVRPLVAIGSTSWPLVIANVAVPLRSLPHTFVDDGLDWPKSLDIAVPASWPSGLYIATVASATHEVTIEFVVRPAGAPTARVLHVWPFLTGEAYYGAAHDSLGHEMNVYQAAATENRHRRRVSFNRPWVGRRIGAAESGLHEFLLGCRDAGGAPAYRIDACSGVDLHRRDIVVGAGGARRYDLIILSGHDEYWTREMRDVLAYHVGHGGRLLLATGNTCWWQVRLTPDPQGRPDRTMIVYKTALEDPLLGVDDARVSTFFCASILGEPENALIGASYRMGGGAWVGDDGATDYRVLEPGSWVFTGLGFAVDSSFAPGAVAYETDAALIDPAAHRATGHDGTPRNYIALASRDLGHWRDKGQGGAATLGYYNLPGGGVVFHLGAMFWDRPLGHDAATQTVIRRIVDRLLDVTTPVPGPGYQPPLTELRPPPTGWQRLQPGPALLHRALAGSIEGVLFGATASPSRLWSRRPEEFAGVMNPWIALDDIPAGHGPVSALGCYAIAPESPLKSRLYAFAGDRMFERLPVREPSPWTTRDDLPPLAVKAAAFSYFRLYVSTGDRLYRDDNDAGGFRWLPIGRAPGVRAMAWGDTCKLFGVRGDRLVARDACDGDLRWVDLGPLPSADVVALAWYYGRLHAQGSQGELWWRSATAEYDGRPGPWRPGQLIACRGALGRVMATPHSGRLLQQQEYGSFHAGWTHIVFADPARAVFYDRATGQCAVTAVDPGSGAIRTTSQPNVGAGYTAVVRVGERRVLFYGNGSGRLDRVELDGTLTPEASWPGGFAQWTHVVATSEDMLLFYNAATGQGYAGRFVGAALQGSAIGGFSTGWRHIVAVGNGCLLFHERSVAGAVTNASALAHLPMGGVVTTLQSWTTLPTGFAQVVGSPNGTVIFCHADGRYETAIFRIGETEATYLPFCSGAPGSLPENMTAISGGSRNHG